MSEVKGNTYKINNANSEARDSEASVNAVTSEAGSDASTARGTSGVSSKILLGVIALVVLLVYGAGVYYFRDHFVKNTYFEGYDFSFQTPEDIVATLEAETKERIITLKEIDGTETIHLHDQIDYNKYAIEPEGGWLKLSTALKWPIYLFTKNNLGGSIKVEYSNEKLEETIDSLRAMDLDNVRKPQDAYLAREGDNYFIVPQDDGNELIREILVATIKNNISGQDAEIDLDKAGCYTKAKIREDDPELTKTYNSYKAINFQKITINMTDAYEVLETPDIVEMRDEDGPSWDKINDYVIGLFDKYNTYERTRPFVNSYGELIQVGSEHDTYGFYLDIEGTTNMLYELMVSTETKEVAPIWSREALTRDVNGGDIGGSYIEVSIDNQALWAYQNGELILATDIVSGKKDRYDTPRGVFSIMLMKKDTHLKGEEKLPNGKVDKWDSFVNFWMALNWAGIGLHNAPWRYSFGGDIYVTGGSHGCVNMDYDSAQLLYTTYDYGTPVVIW